MALSDNLVAFWKLGEASGATRVDSIGSNNLADNNTVTQVAGQLGNAAKFVKASSQFLSIADNADLRTGDIDFTIASWVYLTDKPGGSVAMYFASKWIGGGDQREWELNWNEADDLFEFVVSPTGTSSSVKIQATTFGTPSVATWYFIVAWHDSVNNTLNIQVDNGPVDTLAHTTGVFGGTALFSLGQLDSSGHLNGQLDAFGWYRGILTQLERTQAYNDGAGFQPPFPSPSTFTEPVTVVTQSCDQFTGMVKEIVLPRFAGEVNDPEAIAKFLDEQAEIIEDKFNGRARIVPCDICVESGAIVFDCGQCVHFEVAADQNINSISFINCFEGDEVHVIFNASKDIEISGWPAGILCGSCGDAKTIVSVPEGNSSPAGFKIDAVGNPRELDGLANCVGDCIKKAGNTFNVINATLAGCMVDCMKKGSSTDTGTGNPKPPSGGTDSSGACQCIPGDGDQLTVVVCTEMDCEAAEPKIVITVCGGTGPFTWDVVGGETPTQTDSGTSDRNTKVEPPTNTTPGEAGDAYSRGHAQVRTDRNDPTGCTKIFQAGALYNCAGVRTASCIQRSISEIGEMPAKCESASVNPNPCGCRPEVPCGSACGQPCESEGGCEPCEQATVDLRTQTMKDNGCKPCASTMEGMIVTVTDAVGTRVSTIVRT